MEISLNECISLQICKGGRSANPQVCGLNFFLDLQTFRNCDNLRICDCGHKTSASPQIHIFSSKFADLRTGTPRKFAICGLILTNLWICDCGMSPRICGYAMRTNKLNLGAHWTLQYDVKNTKKTLSKNIKMCRKGSQLASDRRDGIPHSKCVIFLLRKPNPK
jgi:hypothetical protein